MRHGCGDHDGKHLEAANMPFLRMVYKVTMNDKDICTVGRKYQLRAYRLLK
jgi:hypothetical protein